MSNSKNSNPKPTAAKLLVLICTLLGLIFLWQPAIAQTTPRADSLQYTKETKQDTIVKYMDLWEYAFMMHEETSWLFKIDFPVNYRLFHTRLGFEKKIAPSFSLNFNVDLYSKSTNLDEILAAQYTNGFIISIESRWYYRMNKRVREKKVARNMSDNYFAVGFSYGQTISSSFDYQSINVYTKWGFQRRFLKHGHVDFGVKAGVVSLFSEEWRAISITEFVDVGLAFTKSEYELDKEKLCPILKCYDADKFIVKSNLSGLLALIISKNIYIGLEPHIAFERKIGKSAFSVDAELRLYVNFGTWKKAQKNGIWGYGYEALLEGRWYYNLKHRILRGKSGNGLSANYFAIGFNNSFYSQVYASDLRFDRFINQINISTGIQRLYSRHMYFDVSFGFGFNLEQDTYLTAKDYIEYGVKLYTRFALGYRF